MVQLENPSSSVYTYEVCFHQYLFSPKSDLNQCATFEQNHHILSRQLKNTPNVALLASKFGSFLEDYTY